MLLGGALTDRRALSLRAEKRAEPGRDSGNGIGGGKRGSGLRVVQRSSVAVAGRGARWPSGEVAPPPPGEVCGFRRHVGWTSIHLGTELSHGIRERKVAICVAPAKH